MIVGRGTNPLSEQDAGQFSISTFNVIGGIKYLVDTGISATGLFVPQIGNIIKV